MTRFQTIILLFFAIANYTPIAYSQIKQPYTPSVASLSPQDFTYGYWLNGRRKHPTDPSPNILVFETGHYGFHLNLDNLKKCKFGRFKKPLTYRQAHTSRRDTSDALKDAALDLSIHLDGTTYTATSTVAGKSNDLSLARIWESGRIFQHFDILGLNFTSPAGEELPCKADLNIKVWPKSLKINAALQPSLAYSEGSHLGVVGTGLCSLEGKQTLQLNAPIDASQFTLEQWIKIPDLLDRDNKGTLYKWGGNSNTANSCTFKIEHHIFNADLKLGGKSIFISDSRRNFLYDKWNHVALTYDGKYARLYLNGRQISAKPATGGSAPNSKIIHLGHENGNQITESLFDQVRIYNHPLSSSQIYSNFKNPKKSPAPNTPVFSENFDSLPAPKVDTTAWQNARVSLSLSTPTGKISDAQDISGVWPMGQVKELNVQTSTHDFTKQLKSIEVSATVNCSSNLKTSYNPEWLAYTSTVNVMARKWRSGYTDIKNYDEFTINIDNSGFSNKTIPYALHLHSLANTTGLCPILCYADGTPTGIPVQLSKNWHIKGTKAYCRIFANLPAAPGKTIYKLRLAYGFYGTLPSASHAQLSLIGYGGKGRWDQLAIGCWGETICFDTDMSLVDVAITDVRLLMTREGKHGRKWTWTDAGWGGDWLGVRDKDGRKLAFNKVRTAYHAHGPCLTEASFAGYYGAGREVSFQADVSTTRSDDYARTFLTLKYLFNTDIAAEDTWFFKVGRSPRAVSNEVAFGNVSGLKRMITVPQDIQPKENVISQVRLPGRAPWWIGLPTNYLVDRSGKADGSRSLVIRSFKATLGGKAYNNPSFSAPIFRNIEAEGSSTDLLLSPPKGISSYKKGDVVEFELEFLTMPREADDYYGPNETFKSFLAQHPSSWEPIWREAKGNHLKITSQGGKVTSTYPIVIETTEDTVDLQIRGGAGFAPLKFTQLKSSTGYQLYQKKGEKLELFDQSMHGNDFWQTNYDPSSNTYERVYNIPLDRGGLSQWILKKE